jgi:hypothetical protein
VNSSPKVFPTSPNKDYDAEQQEDSSTSSPEYVPEDSLPPESCDESPTEPPLKKRGHGIIPKRYVEQSVCPFSRRRENRLDVPLCNKYEKPMALKTVMNLSKLG